MSDPLDNYVFEWTRDPFWSLKPIKWTVTDWGRPANTPVSDHGPGRTWTGKATTVEEARRQALGVMEADLRAKRGEPAEEQGELGSEVARMVAARGLAEKHV